MVQKPEVIHVTAKNVRGLSNCRIIGLAISEERINGSATLKDTAITKLPAIAIYP